MIVIKVACSTVLLSAYLLLTPLHAARLQHNADGTENTAFFFARHSEHLHAPDVSGMSISCDDGAYKLGTKLADGMQGGIYEVVGHPDKVAKVENGPNPNSEKFGSNFEQRFEFEIDECKRTRMVKAAGVQAPDCFGLCNLESTNASGALIAMIHERIHGDAILKHDDDKNIVLGETMKMMKHPDGYYCSDGQKQLTYEMWRQCFRMINAGFANADQHIGNMMLGSDGKVWFIDFGVKHLWAQKAKSNEERWNDIVGRMVRIVWKATQLPSKYDPCVEDPILTLKSAWFSEQVNTLNPGEKHEVCDRFKKVVQACM